MPEGRDIEGAMDARAGRAAAEVEAAGGMEMGGADLAGALADALAGANVDDLGTYAVQDAETMATEEGDVGAGVEAQAQAAAQAAYDDVIGSDAGLAQATQFAGPQMTAPGQSTSPYSSDYGTYATPQASQYGAMSELGLTGHQFAQGNPIGYMDNATTQQTVEDQLTGGGAAAVDSFSNMPTSPYGETMATEEFDSPTMGIAGLQPESIAHFSQPNQARVNGSAAWAGQNTANFNTTGWDPSTNDPRSRPGVYGVGTEAAPANPNEQFMADQAAQAAPGTDFFGGGPDYVGAHDVTGGLITGAATGAITAGTTTTTPQLSQDENAVLQDKVHNIVQKVNTPETNTAEYKQVAQSRLDMQATLDQKAKADPNGNSGYPGVSNQELANAYSGFDTTLAAHATINGQNSLVSMIANNLPGVNMASQMLGGISGFLVNRGIFNKASGQEIAEMIGHNLAAGLRPGMDSQWESGPSDQDVQGPQEISAFIQQHPWAAELDPRYIKYLIDNPAELQDLLGQGPGGE